MAISQWMVSSFFPEKSSGSLAFISAGLAVVLATSMSGCLGAGSKGSSSSLVISILGSGVGMLVGSGREEMVIGRGSSAVGDSYHDRTFDSSRHYVFPCLPSLQMGFLFPGDDPKLIW